MSLLFQLCLKSKYVYIKYLLTNITDKIKDVECNHNL